MLMTPKNPRWQEFGDKLCAIVDPSTCDHTTCHVERLLSEMDADVEASLIEFRKRAGDCSCTIILNFGLALRDTDGDDGPL